MLNKNSKEALKPIKLRNIKESSKELTANVTIHGKTCRLTMRQHSISRYYRIIYKGKNVVAGTSIEKILKALKKVKTL